MGLDDSAIITINANSSPERKRFSGGHELGHWMRDRGTATFQCNEQMFVREWSEDNPEKRANRFAADLLLPAKMFRPLSKDLPITFASVEKLAAIFKMSLSATAIRLVEYGSYPAMLICNSPGRTRMVCGQLDGQRKALAVRSPGPIDTSNCPLAGTYCSVGTTRQTGRPVDQELSCRSILGQRRFKGMGQSKCSFADLVGG